MSGRPAPTGDPIPLVERLPAEIRPDGSLLRYYALTALLTGPAFPFVFLYFLGRYRTLRYEIDDEGISARWGVLFRREVSLNYARIQDIHLSSNVVERWLGLGKIQIQTASAKSGAEMTLEGIRELETVRDFLYGRMRGARPGTAGTAGTAGATGATGTALDAGIADGRSGADGPAAGPRDDELVRTLREVVEELRSLRAALESRPPPP